MVSVNFIVHLNVTVQVPRDAADPGSEGPGHCFPALHVGEAVREAGSAGEKPGAQIWCDYTFSCLLAEKHK